MAMDSPAKISLSVVIPTLNEAAVIGRCLQRARALSPLEIIVADGGSDDGTAPLAEKLGATVVTGARGRAAQQNLGARQALGDVLLFLHADTWLPAQAAGQISTALQDPRVVCGAFRQRIEAEGVGYRIIEFGNTLRAAWLRMPYGDQAIFVRRADFMACGRFPTVRILEELHLMRTLRRRGRLVVLPGPLRVSARRWQRRGIVRQTLRNWLILLLAAVRAPESWLVRLYPPDR